MIEKGLVFGDTHVPNEDGKAVELLMRFTLDFKPDVLVDLGDTCDFPSVNHWLPKGDRRREGQRLVKDIQHLLRFSFLLKNNCPTHCDCVKLTGNHEHWLQRFVNENPALEGLPDLDLATQYKEMNWKVVPWSQFYNRGKLMFHHGDRLGYQGKYHAAQWATLGHSIIYGHRHDVQRFTHEVLGKRGDIKRHAAFAMGCLCKFDMDYMRNRKMNWQQGFGVWFSDTETGAFQVCPIDINNGRLVWLDKLYEAGKVVR